MNRTRMAQQLRALSALPSLESDASNVDASTETGPAGEAVVKVDVEEPQQTPADGEGAPAEDKDLTTKIVEEDKGPKEESAETTSDDAEVLTTSQESLLVAGTVMALLSLAGGYAVNKASKLKQQYEELAAKKEALEGRMAQLTDKIGDEVVARLKREGHAAEAIAYEKASAQTKKERGILTFMGGASVAMSGPASPIVAGVYGLVWAANKAAFSKLQKDYAQLQVDLADKEAEIAALALEAKEEGKVSQESLADPAVSAALNYASLVVSRESEDGALENAAAAAAAHVAEGAAAAAEAAAAAAASVSGTAEEVVAEATGDTAEEVVEAADEEAEGAAEIEELEAGIDEAEEHAETYEQEAATLEALIDALEDARQSGGATPREARLFSIGFESIGVRLTGKPFTNGHGENAMPSLESFGGTMRRDQATTISLEAAGDWLKKIWEVIQKTWAQVKEFVIQFAKAIFTQIGRLKARAERVKAAAAKIGITKPKEASFVFAGASRIATEKKVSDDGLGDARAMAVLAGHMTKENKQIAAAFADVFQKAVEAAKSADEGGKGTITGFVTAMQGLIATDERVTSSVQAAKSVFKNESLDGPYKVFTSRPLAGNVVIEIRSGEIDVDTLVKIGNNIDNFKDVWTELKPTIGAALRQKKTVIKPLEVELSDQDKTVQTLNSAEIGGIATEVLAILSDIQGSEKEMERETASLKASMSANPDDFGPIGRALVNTVGSSLAQGLVNFNGSSTKMLKYAANMCAAYLDYAEANLKQYGLSAGIVSQAADAVKDKAVSAADAARKKMAGKDEAVATESLVEDGTVSMEGVKGALVGACIGFFAFGVGSIPGAIIGHLVEEYRKNKARQEELAKLVEESGLSSSQQTEFEKLRQRQLELEHKILEDAKKKDEAAK